MFNVNKSNEFQVYGSQISRGTLSAITKEDVLTVLDDEERSFRYLIKTPFHRALPTCSKLTSSAADALREVLKNGSVPRGLENDLGRASNIAINRGGYIPKCSTI